MLIQIEISDKSIELLKLIKKAHVAEYLDTEYESLAEFKESQSFKNGYLTEKYFINRNFSDLKDLNELIATKLIEHYGQPWETCYAVSELGNKVLENLETGILKINYN